MRSIASALSLMNPRLNKRSEKAKKQRAIPTVSAVFGDGAILETVYSPTERRTGFVLWRDDKWTAESSIPVDPLRRLVPYSSHNNLIKNEVVLLPSEPEE